MHKSQANRAVIRARALSNSAGASSSTAAIRSSGVNINLLARTNVPKVLVTGYVRRTRCAPMTAAMKSGDNSGNRSLWTATPYLRDMVANDSKWSKTISDIG